MLWCISSDNVDWLFKGEKQDVQSPLTDTHLNDY